MLITQWTTGNYIVLMNRRNKRIRINSMVRYKINPEMSSTTSHRILQFMENIFFGQ